MSLQRLEIRRGYDPVTLICALEDAYAEIDRLEGVLAAKREMTRKASEKYRLKNLDKTRAMKRAYARRKAMRVRTNG